MGIFSFANDARGLCVLNFAYIDCLVGAWSCLTFQNN